MLDAIRATITRSSIPLTIALPDEPDAPVMLANDAFRKMVGHGDDAIIGRNCRFLQGPLTVPEQRVVFRDAISRFCACRGLITNYTSDGRVFLNYVLMFPIQDPRTGLRAILGSQFDITPNGGRDIVRHARMLAAVLRNVEAGDQCSALLAGLDAVSTTISQLVQSRLDLAHLDSMACVSRAASWIEMPSQTA